MPSTIISIMRHFFSHLRSSISRLPLQRSPSFCLDVKTGIVPIPLSYALPLCRTHPYTPPVPVALCLHRVAASLTWIVSASPTHHNQCALTRGVSVSLARAVRYFAQYTLCQAHRLPLYTGTGSSWRILTYRRGSTWYLYTRYLCTWYLYLRSFTESTEKVERLLLDFDRDGVLRPNHTSTLQHQPTRSLLVTSLDGWVRCLRTHVFDDSACVRDCDFLNLRHVWASDSVFQFSVLEGLGEGWGGVGVAGGGVHRAADDNAGVVEFSAAVDEPDEAALPARERVEG